MSKSLKQFKEQFDDHSIFEQMVQEVLSKDADAGAWIKDFVKSDNPKFAGKSKEQRKKQALAAYYAKQRNEETELEEGVVDAVKKVAKKAAEVLGGPDDEGHKKDLQRKMGATPEQQHGKKSMAKYNEEVESLDEGKMDKMSLSHLWHAHAHHSYGADQGWGGGDGGKHSKHAATAIENHVRKHYGNKVADDMVSHSDNHVAHAEYVGGEAAKEVEHDAEKLRKKHNIKGNLYGMNEETEQIDEKLNAKKKTMDTLAGRVKVPASTDNEHSETKIELKSESWDDMLKDVKAKRGPQPSGGSGVKQGSRYGGGKQKDKPEQDEDKKKVTESKRPEDDSVPFAPPYNTTSTAVVTDKSGAQHTPLSKAKHLARLAMTKMKKDLGKKGK